MSKFPSVSRQHAAQKLAKSERHDAALFQERKAREAANLEKTMRLRNLRLAKEAADRDAAAAAPPAKPARRKSRASAAQES